MNFNPKNVGLVGFGQMTGQNNRLKLYSQLWYIRTCATLELCHQTNELKSVSKLVSRRRANPYIFAELTL